ncbi:hypothetical protein CEXT_199661 [Caerostris extrusa]|uniref:Uncharacterized protein n=1 Tax=Caerostris extrusa TaxID=172846 RepID=A0AAV4MFR4_CAEEX|nr:hypothetical protein CEXT_199661 [Caerostris extrusa]
MQVADVIDTIMNWRQVHDAPTVSNRSVDDYYNYFREIAETSASHYSKQLEGLGVIRKTTNHCKREFVDKKNKTINPLARTRINTSSGPSSEKMPRQYMMSHYYRRIDHTRGKKKKSRKTSMAVHSGCKGSLFWMLET